MYVILANPVSHGCPPLQRDEDAMNPGEQITITLMCCLILTCSGVNVVSSPQITVFKVIRKFTILNRTIKQGK